MPAGMRDPHQPSLGFAAPPPPADSSRRGTRERWAEEEAAAAAEAEAAAEAVAAVEAAEAAEAVAAAAAAEEEQGLDPRPERESEGDLLYVSLRCTGGTAALRRGMVAAALAAMPAALEMHAYADGEAISLEPARRRLVEREGPALRRALRCALGVRGATLSPAEPGPPAEPGASAGARRQAH